MCQEEHGSDLVIVDNDQENDFLYTFAKENEIHVWIGIQEKVTGTNENNETTYDFFWIDGQLVNSEAETSFSKWAEGGNQPEYGKIFSSHRKTFLYSACRSMNGTARGAIMKNADGFWQTRDKMQKFGFVCEKTVYDR